MRFLKSVNFLVLILFSAVMFAQSGANSAAASNASVADQLKQLQDAMAAQQKQITLQQQQIEALRTQLANQGQAHVVDATMHPGATADDMAVAAVTQPSSAPEGETEKKDSPLSFRIGEANFTPGGFVDFTNVFRTTNTGNPIGTNFGQIPFSNTVAGHLTEYRSTAQHSRLSLKVDSNYHDMKITGYVEADFNGNDPANVFVSTNSHTNRLRLYQVDLRKNNWEILAGQTWSLLTPNRVGISPDPADIFLTRNMDPNYQVGLQWARQAGFRVGYHPDEHWALALGIENPQQFVGNGEVTFPFVFNAQLGGQLDNTAVPGTPNLHPDIVPKITYDHNFAGDKHFHGELAGLLTSVRVTHLPTPVFFGSFESVTKTGGGGSGAIFVDLAKQFKLVGTGFYSYGGGRYLFGLGPQAVVRPLGTGVAADPFKVDLSLVHAGGTVFGFESPLNKTFTLAGYYGGAYFGRNAFLDQTNPLPNRIIGFGGPSSPNSANRAIQEGTGDLIWTFFKDPKYGSLQMLMQYSYVTRSPWFVAAGAPKNAHLSMAFIDLRYVLP
jgi:hypothetical protein